MNIEEWKDIKGYEGLYQVSSLGQIRSLDILINIEDSKKDRAYKSRKKGKILKPFLSNNGYLRVCLCKDRKQTTKAVHRLVAETFLSNPRELPQVNHVDGNKSNNCVANLEWCTAQENIKHSWDNGLSKVTKEMREHCKKYNKKVNQYDKRGDFLKEWESATEAGRNLNIFQQSIVACLKGRTKTAGGYIWKYATPEQKYKNT